MEKIITIKGKRLGPTSIILAGVHGNEKCGVAAFKKILPTLKIDRGVVFFGYGNPKAIQANKRYQEANLNRLFIDKKLLSQNLKRSYEFRRALFLKKHLNQADALLDLHASSNYKSRPFAICETNAKNIVKYLPINSIVSGFDKVEPGGTDYYMNKHKKIGICVECGYLKSPQSTITAKKIIFAFLKSRGHLPNDLKYQKQTHLRMYKKYFTKTPCFKLTKKFHDFENIPKGAIIGVDGAKKIRATKDGFILFAQDCQKINAEAFLLGEKKDSLAF